MDTVNETRETEATVTEPAASAAANPNCQRWPHMPPHCGCPA